MAGGLDCEIASRQGETRTIVLVGRTGNGKSATGNTILGMRLFQSKTSSSGVTTTCELQRRLLENGPILNVIDTPGLFDFSARGTVGKEIAKCVDLAKEGIHAFLLVLSVKSRFSVEELAAVQSLQRLFGTKINDYMIIVFTGGDELEEDESTLDDYLGYNCPQPLKEILEICGHRRVLFDNKTKDESKKREQMSQLLALIDNVAEKNGGIPFIQESTGEIDSFGIYSTSELEKKFQDSYKEQLQTSMEMIESKLSENVRSLEQKLSEVLAAREKAETSLKQQLAEDKASREKANAALVEANRKHDKMQEELDRTKREADEHKKQSQKSRSSFCSIL